MPMDMDNLAITQHQILCIKPLFVEVIIDLKSIDLR
jgi:hypothetical protein